MDTKVTLQQLEVGWMVNAVHECTGIPDGRRLDRREFSNSYVGMI